MSDHTYALAERPLVVASWIRDAIITHAQAHLPYESCGLLGDDGHDATLTRLHHVAVREPSPISFTMDSVAQWEAHQIIESNGGRWRAIWHSHPTSAAFPSATDRAQSLAWPGIVAIIISLVRKEPVIRAFSVHDGREVVEYPIVWTGEHLR